MKRHHYFGISVVIALMVGVYAFIVTRPVYLAETDLAARTTERAATVSVGDATFRVTLARTEDERAKGLMHITSLADDEGMVFVFEREESQTFWNKNTKLNLIVVWIAGGKVIGVSNLPNDDDGIRLISSPAPITHALEVAQTSPLASRVKIGDSVAIHE